MYKYTDTFFSGCHPKVRRARTSEKKKMIPLKSSILAPDSDSVGVFPDLF